MREIRVPKCPLTCYAPLSRTVHACLSECAEVVEAKDNASMRVLHIVADGFPGGGTTIVLALSEELRKNGLEPGVITQRDSYALNRASSMGLWARGIDFFRSRFDLRVPALLRKAARDFAPDVFHVHGSRAGFFFGLLPRSPGFAPAVYSIHGYHFLGKYWGVRHLGSYAERLAHRRADCIVFACEYDQAIARAWGIVPQGKNSVIIQYGLRTEDIPPRKDFDPHCVGFFGRLVYQKDPLLFVETMRILADEGFTAKMVGGGDLEQPVKRLISRYGLDATVRVLGRLPRDQALREIAETGIVVMPSRWEATPVALMEAMLMGIPVVAAPVAGIPEVIDDGISGILVSERDAQAYAAAVRRVVRQPGLAGQLCENARKRIEEKFAFRNMVSGYESLYRRLVRPRR
jgi:glycosyltransferase involved in cell wall biosynthesis